MYEFNCPQLELLNEYLNIATVNVIATVNIKKKKKINVIETMTMRLEQCTSKMIGKHKEIIKCKS